VEHLVHGARGLGTTRLPDDLGRHAGHGHIVRHRLYHHGTRSDPGAMTDFDIAEDFGARSDHDAMANLGMTILVFLARSAKRNAVQDRDIVLDPRRLAANKTGGMVQKDATPDSGRRIDIGLEYGRG